MRSRSQEICEDVLDFRGQQEMTLLRTVFKAGSEFVDGLCGRIGQLGDDGQGDRTMPRNRGDSSMSRCMRWAARLMRPAPNEGRDAAPRGPVAEDGGWRRIVPSGFLRSCVTTARILFVLLLLLPVQRRVGGREGLELSQQPLGADSLSLRFGLHLLRGFSAPLRIFSPVNVGWPGTLSIERHRQLVADRVDEHQIRSTRRI